MAKIDNMVQDFLAQKKIAVVGVSDKRETGCNAAYLRFKENGYQVYPVNPRVSTYDGVTCYPDLKSIPDKPDAVFILANPKVTDEIVQECVDLGIKNIWMHCMMGTKPGLAANITVSGIKQLFSYPNLTTSEEISRGNCANFHQLQSSANLALDQSCVDKHSLLYNSYESFQLVHTYH